MFTCNVFPNVKNQSQTAGKVRGYYGYYCIRGYYGYYCIRGYYEISCSISSVLRNLVSFLIGHFVSQYSAVVAAVLYIYIYILCVYIIYVLYI